MDGGDVLRHKTIQSHDTVYSVQNVIGIGCFSRVYRATDAAGGGETVVIKVLNDKNTRRQNPYLKELGVLHRLKSSPVRERYVDLRDAFRLETGEICFVMERLGVTLHAVLHNVGSLPMTICRSISRQIAQGLAGLKCLDIVHADLKPDNIMFCAGPGNNHLVKIIDFGWAFYKKNSHVVFCKKIQAIPYRAPEVCFRRNLDYGLDMWALGCIMPEIVTGVKLFDVNDEEQLIRHIVRMLPVPENLLSDLQRQQQKENVETTVLSNGWQRFHELYLNAANKNHAQREEDVMCFMDLVMRMLLVVPKERITAADALMHPFLTMAHFVKYPSTAMTKKNVEMMDKCNLHI